MTKTKKNLMHDNRGIGLMESIAVIGIMTIILVMVSQIFAVSYDVFIKQSARTDNETSAVIAARVISDMTRDSSVIQSSRTINGTTYTTSANTLVLQMPTIDSNNNVVTGSYDYIAFYRDGTTPTKIFSDTQPAPGSKKVQGKKLVTAYNSILTFRYNNSDITKATRVQVHLVNTQIKRSVTITTKAWTAIFLRNF